MIADHLPPLQVVLPLICAPLIVVVRRLGFAWMLATLVSATSLAIAIALSLRVAAGGTISYAIGSWPPPWGIEYRVDAFNSYLLVLISAIGTVVMPYARKSVVAELPREQEYLFYAMYCLCLAGLLGIVITGDAFNVFVFLEISSLSTYVMIAMGRRRQALVAAFQYLVTGTVGATFYIIGVGLLYLMTGTLNMVDMAQRLADVQEVRPVLAALAFITVGIGLKLALFPLHQWLPPAYTFAPSTVTVFLAATATKVSVYVLLRFYFVLFGDSLVFGGLPFAQVLLVLSVLAMLTASVVAIFQDDLKRMFAYSSVAQIGYITLGISLDNAAGLTGAIAHMFNHGITKGALFMLVGCIALRCQTTRFSELAGVAHRMPVTALGIVIAGLSLIGIPATAGFTTKWYLVIGALERGMWPVAAAVVASSMLAVAYVWRFVEIAWLREPAANLPATRREPPLWLLLPAWLLVAATVYFGVETSFNIGMARGAADFLLRGGW
jgi:multicomponent Na+:H+ antiporter subunit D